ncbi:MAG: hypothetical protein Q9165_001410 [Trypethelium subeluteriae]
MSKIDFLLHESAVGYAIFKVNMQADTIGNRLKEAEDTAEELSLFGTSDLRYERDWLD